MKLLQVIVLTLLASFQLVASADLSGTALITDGDTISGTKIHLKHAKLIGLWP